MYVKCQEPVDDTECPENSAYLAGAGQFGCCGACVIFKSKYHEYILLPQLSYYLNA